MMFEKMMHERQYSDETAKVIDDEVEHLITEAGQRARDVLKGQHAQTGRAKKGPY